MHINFSKQKKYNMHITGIIHVGALNGKEFSKYSDNHIQIIHALKLDKQAFKDLKNNIRLNEKCKNIKALNYVLFTHEKNKFFIRRSF
jgi:hypothetical protein